MKFVKKPVVIDAFKLGTDEAPQWFTESEEVTTKNNVVTIKTPEGNVTAKNGDYIIKGITGELSLCKADVFETSYDVVPETFWDRLLVERKELAVKANALLNFTTTETFNKLDAQAKLLLTQQHLIMSRYLKILDARIKLATTN